MPAAPALPCALVAGSPVAENLPPGLAERAHLAGRRRVRIDCPVDCSGAAPGPVIESLSQTAMSPADTPGTCDQNRTLID